MRPTAASWQGSPLIDRLGQRLGHYWRTAKSHRLVIVPKPPSPAIRAEVLGSRSAAPTDYHIWYYGTGVWKSTTWQGVRTQKSVSDMWSYQEILAELRPRLLVEFGMDPRAAILRVRDARPGAIQARASTPASPAR